MAKLTNRQYLSRHARLRHVWNEDHRFFTLLTYQQQRDLHDYFQPTKDWTDQEPIDHRHKVSRADPGIPQRAGRALKAMLRPENQPRPRPATTTKSRVKNITVHPLAKPELDVEKLAMALVGMIKHMSPEERAELEAEGQKVLDDRSRTFKK
jgi:hypothetical protein